MRVFVAVRNVPMDGASVAMAIARVADRRAGMRIKNCDFFAIRKS
jgi:hypothetical protein